MSRRRTGPTPDVVAEVIARAGHRCERCGDADGPFAVHHRKPRRAGGTSDPAINDPVNLALLCDFDADSCHRWTEDQPAEAYDTGWLVHSWEDPAEVVPLRLVVTVHLPPLETA